MHDSPPRQRPVAAPPARTVRAWHAVAAVAVVGGLVLGAIDLFLQELLPSPWAGLANSAAVWAIAAFAFGAWAQDRARGVCGAIVLLAVAVEAYYAVAAFVLGDSTGNLTSAATAIWLAFAVIAGAVFGWAGVGVHSGEAWLRGTFAAFAPGVLLAEAINLVRLHERPPAVLECVLAVTLGMSVVLAAGRDRHTWAWTVLACVPLTVVGAGLYAAAGYGG